MAFAARACAILSLVTAASGLRVAPALSLSHLRSGSDVRAEGLTPAQAGRIGHGFAAWVLQGGAGAAGGRPSRVAIGQDPRDDGNALAEAFCEGVRAAGLQPVRFGLATTPAMFASCFLGDEPFSAGVMITASHLPSQWNGMKFFTPRGGLGGADVAALLDLGERSAEADAAPVPPPTPGAARADFMAKYKEDLVAQMRHLARRGGVLDADAPLKGLRVVVNAGNGGGGAVVDVLEALGADTAGSVHLEPDGRFPAHTPNPEDPAMVRETLRAVAAAGAHVGVMLDTDVDRSGLIDGATLEPLNRNRLIAAAARMVLRERPGATIVTDSVTSNGLKRFIAAEGGVHLRYKKGYRNVIDKAAALCAAGTDAPLAIECSGHAALRDNRWMDDGAYLAVRLLLEFAALRAAAPTETLVGLVRGLQEPRECEEFRMGCRDGAAREAEAARLREHLRAAAAAREGWSLEEPNYEGVRVTVDEGEGRAGWVSVRESLHEPMVIVNAESERDGGIASLLRGLFAGAGAFDAGGLDTAPVLAYIE